MLIAVVESSRTFLYIRQTASEMKEIKLILLSGLIIALLFAAGLEFILRVGMVENPLFDRRQIQGKVNHHKYKLLVIGDSFIVPKSLLGTLLSRDLGSYDVAVLNVATSGTGPFEYLEEIKTVATEFKPDVVLLSYYAGNDLTNVQNHPNFKPFRQRDKQTGVAINSSSSRPFFRHLYLYHYLLRSSQTVRRWFFNYEEMEAAGIPPDLIEDAKTSKINPWLLRLALDQKNYFLDNLLMETDENIRAWQKAKELLTEVHEISTRHNSQLVMIVFPASVQVNESHFDFLKRLRFNMDDKTLKSAKPQRLLLEFCGERNIRCLDVLPSLRARRSEEFYRDKDDHFNEAGNRLAGTLIVEFMLKNTAIGSRVKAEKGVITDAEFKQKLLEERAVHQRILNPTAQ